MWTDIDLLFDILVAGWRDIFLLRLVNVFFWGDFYKLQSGLDPT